MSRYIEEPFTSLPTCTCSPDQPQPCAWPPHAQRHSPAFDSRNSREAEHPDSHYRQFGSMSSSADSALMTPDSTRDLEKAVLAKEAAPKDHTRHKKHKNRSRESQISEKPMEHRPGGVHSSSNSHTSSVIVFEQEPTIDETRQLQEQKAVKILLFLSGPCVLLSALNSAWACIAIVVTFLTQPIRICAKRPTFGQQLAGLLGPSLNLQLRSIYTPLPPHANEDASYHSFMLLVEHLLSPFLSFVMMFAAWTLAVYWVSSAMVGDPAGQDKRDDGKESVLGLRRWWERWLTKSVKNEQW